MHIWGLFTSGHLLASLDAQMHVQSILYFYYNMKS